VPADGDSHTSDRIAGLLESGADDQKKSTEAMAQGGVRENPGVPRSPAAPKAAESKAASAYREFASDILARSYNDLGVMRAKASQFAEASEYFKQAAAWKPALPGLDRNWGLAAIVRSFIPKPSRRSNAGLPHHRMTISSASFWA